MSLSPEQLLAALNYDTATSSKFPEAALREIISRREEMTPVLLDVLEACRANPADFNTSVRCFQPVYAVYLLAQFRETRAYRPIIALMELDAETTEKCSEIRSQRISKTSSLAFTMEMRLRSGG